MADDDLDDFFDAVEAVAAEAIKEDEKRSGDQEAIITKTTEEDDVQPPPFKKAKTSSNGDSQPTAAAAALTRPVGGVVVASSATATPAVSAEAVKYVAPPSVVTTIRPAAPVTKSTATTTTITQSSPMASAPQQQQPKPPLVPPVPPPSSQQQNPQHSRDYTKRAAAGKLWVDPTLDEWPENDYRLFVGNLAKDVTDEKLFDHFSKYPSIAMAKVVRDAKNNNVSKGYGFVSLMQPMECARAIREMDQTWLSTRPIRVKKSDWKERDFKVVRKKEKKSHKKQRRMGL